MRSYAARAVPWGRVAGVGVLVLLMMEIVRRQPWTMWPLEGCSVGLLAAGAAWCFDESAAAVVDAAPRSLAWRTAARASGAAVLLLVWAVAVIRAQGNLFGHPGEVLLQGLAAVLCAAAWTTLKRSYGQATPGVSAAALVVPLAASVALVRPYFGWLPVFPYADGSAELGSWATSRAGWLAAGTLAAIVLGATLLDARWQPAHLRARRR